MRRLPIYFLVDVSESMVGTPIEQVQDGMRTIIQSLRKDPYALETVFVSVIAFAGKAKVLTPLSELYKFYPPIFPIGGGTAIGAGLEALMADIDSSVNRTTAETKGDWRPIVFLFTDGNPTDKYQAAFNRWNEKYRRRCNLIVIAIGENVNTNIPAQITDEVLILKDTTPESFSKFFKWLSQSIAGTSMSVCDNGTDEVRYAPTSGINLEKVNTKEKQPVIVDENYAVLHGRCQNTKNDYLIKFARRSQPIEGLESFSTTDFRLVGAYPVDKESYATMSSGESITINSAELVGLPTCPCCGNQIGAVVCQCGGIFCAGDNPVITCPWCGVSGQLGQGGPGGIDVSRGQG